MPTNIDETDFAVGVLANFVCARVIALTPEPLKDDEIKSSIRFQTEAVIALFPNSPFVSGVKVGDISIAEKVFELVYKDKVLDVPGRVARSKNS